MFKNFITLFNYSETENIYYPTFITRVEFQPQYRANYTSESTQSDDVALLIINYKLDKDGKKIVCDKNYTTPMEWQSLSKEDKEKNFTFAVNEYDFFIKGAFSKEKDVDYETFKNSHDEVFLVHSVRDFDGVLKHFEITGC